MATKVTAEFNIFAVSNDPRVLWLQYNLALAGVLKTNAFGIKSPEEKEREERRKDEEFMRLSAKQWRRRNRLKRSI